MDYDKAKRYQSIKVIFSEIIMFITVIVTVVILAFIVSGYWINEKFEVERQGMLQISSSPTGADVFIDDESSWLQKTNTSKVLPVGEHSIRLTKDGYDSWTKTVNITEGLLYRLPYPRLFPLHRDKTIVYDALGVTEAFLSDDRGKLLLYSGSPNDFDIDDYTGSVSISSSESDDDKMPLWTLIDLKSHKIEGKTVTRRTLREFFKPQEQDIRDTIEDYKLPRQPKNTDELIFSRFYDNNYLTIVDDNNIALYKKGETTPILLQELSFTPSDYAQGRDGDFIAFYADSKVATLDMELLSIKEWSVDGNSIGWLDDNMIYTVSDGELIVYDYDGLNRRSIARNVSDRFPIVITGDDWLYYFSNDNLVRENLRAS